MAIESIIIAVLSMLGTLSGAYFANRKSSALIAYRVNRKSPELIAYRLEQLEKKVDLHNNAIERVYELERRAGVTDEKLKEANRRLKNLERTNRGDV